MNSKLFLPLALAFPMFASCDKAADAADNAGNNAKEMADNLDLDSMSPDAIKEKGGEIVDNLKSALEDITDVESAKAAVSKFTPKLEKLSDIKDKLAGMKIPGMDDLGSAVETIKEKFAGDNAIMDALKPLMEKIQNLMG